MPPDASEGKPGRNTPWWGWVLACLLFALSGAVQLSHAAPTQMSSPDLQVMNVDDGSTGPCQGDGTASRLHCHVTGVCSPFISVQTSMIALVTTPAYSPVMTRTDASSRVIEPHLRPPNAFAQA